MNKQLIKKFKKYDDTFVNRPLGKPDETVRGRLLKWNGSDYVAFEPQKSKDTPARTVYPRCLSFTFAPRNQSWFKCEGCLK